MKKLFYVLFLLLVSFTAIAQETPPSGLKAINSQFYIHLPDSTIWQQKGAPYNWHRVAKYSELQAMGLLYLLKSDSTHYTTRSFLDLNYFNKTYFNANAIKYTDTTIKVATPYQITHSTSDFYGGKTLHNGIFSITQTGVTKYVYLDNSTINAINTTTGNTVLLNGNSTTLQYNTNGFNNTLFWDNTNSSRQLWLPNRGGDTLTTKGMVAAAIATIPTAASPANPTAIAGTSPINGSATTYMRSDAAPKIDSTAFTTRALISTYQTKAQNVASYGTLSQQTANTSAIASNYTAIGLKQPRIIGNKPTATSTTYTTADSVSQVLANLNSGVIANSADISAIPVYTASFGVVKTSNNFTLDTAFSHAVVQPQINTLASRIATNTTNIAAKADTFKYKASVWVDTLGNNTTAKIGRFDKPFATIAAAIASLPSTGGIVNVGPGSFIAPTNAQLKSNISIIGSGRPSPNWAITINGLGVQPTITSPTKLTGGTIILGTLDHSGYNNMRFEHLGVDVGSAWATAFNSGVGADGLKSAQLVGSSSSDGLHTIQTANKPNYGLYINDVSVLGQSATAAFHDVLIENQLNPNATNIYTYYNTHGFVSKSLGGQFENIHDYGHHSDGFILKSNDYAYGYAISANNIYCSSIVGNDGAGIALIGEGNGILAYIKLTNFHCEYTTSGVVGSGSTGGSLTGIQLENGTCYNIAGNNIYFGDGNTTNLSISNVEARTSTGVGFYIVNPTGNSKLVNCGAYGGTIGFYLSSSAGGSRINVVNLNTSGGSSSPFQIIGNVYGNNINYASGTPVGTLKNDVAASTDNIAAIDVLGNKETTAIPVNTVVQNLPAVSASSGVATASTLTSTLTATSNSDKLKPFVLSPTYVDGAFTGVIHYGFTQVGTGLNVFPGNTRIGSSADPAFPLDVAGSVNSTGSYLLSGNNALSASGATLLLASGGTYTATQILKPLTLTGKTTFAAGTTTTAMFGLPTGAAKTTPTAGDTYWDGTNLFASNGTGYNQFAYLASPTFTGNAGFTNINTGKLSAVITANTPTGAITDSVTVKLGVTGKLGAVPITNFVRTSTVKSDLTGNAIVIQSSADLAAQTTAGNITTFTVGASNATFGVAIYVNVTAVATDVIQGQVTYTDENNTAQTVSLTSISTVTNSQYSPVIIRCKAGTVITAKTNLTTGVGSITFDAGARINQL